MDRLDSFRAARIIGCTPREVADLLDGRPATQETLEQIAIDHYSWRRHVDDDPDSYWVTVKQAAGILGVSIQRVKQYLDNEQVPMSGTATAFASCAASSSKRWRTHDRRAGSGSARGHAYATDH